MPGLMLYHVHASNMFAYYRLGDYDVEDESEAIAEARRESRQRNHGTDILTGLLIKAFPHRPGRTCEHTRNEEE